jgi:ATP-dependent Clp protease ATP-binding subunit ClpC
MNNQFSQKVSDIIVLSKEEAGRLRSRYIQPEHLLLGLLREGSGKAIDILSVLKTDFARLKSEIEKATTEKNPSVDLISDADLSLSTDSSRILKIAILESRLLKSPVADTEHLLLALLRDRRNIVAETLNRTAGVSYESVREQLSLQPGVAPSMGFTDDDDDDDELMDSAPGNNAADEAKKQQTSTKRPTNSTPALDMFGTDITKAAAEGKLDPVIGRDKEIERLAMILSRRKKNNPVLIGDPGVGKSAIVEGLALRIVKRQVSRILYDKRVIALDMTAALAGTKYRGQFEERIRSILSEVQKNPDIILFIDEIHNIVGAGGSAGSIDAANMMKPALARGTIQCIGATTPDEYRKSIEKDGALERRFQKVMVEPTTVEETIQILHNIKDKYEEHHNVTFTDDAIEACVRLTERYISDRKFPDKAIDAMDEAGAKAYISNVSVPKEIEQQEALIEEAKAKKNQAVKDQNFELAASFRDREKELSEALETMKSEWEKNAKNDRKVIDASNIEEIVSMISGVPVQRMAQTEGARLHEMKEYLQSKIVAQDEPISKLVKAILRSRAGIKDPNKPIGTFMFLGPTGVGKTHLAKELAKFMFGSTDALIRVDMSEYMEKFNVSRLVGAPPGYVGYEEGGQLTERVRRKPYSIVLLDEIEKAHPDVFNLLLQVMDEGRLTDSNGRIVDFKNTVIIMTSNVGTRQLKEFSHGIGFASQASANDQTYANGVIQKALHKSFSPEFLNRIDEILTFNQLSVEAIKSIIDIELKELLKRTEAIGIKLVVTDEAKEFVATKGYDAQYGARPLKRAIQTYLEDELAEVLIDTQSACIGRTVTASLDSDKQKIVMTIEE